jgi:toxin YoeB
LILAFEDAGWEDYRRWAEESQAVRRRVDKLIDSALRTPRGGLGNPEPLTGPLRGAWSRRITAEHRLVYRVEGDTLVVMQARYHYAK